VLPTSLKAGISEAAAFTRQRARRTVTTQRTSATQLGESISIATELLLVVFTLPSTTYLLKIIQRDRIRRIETQSQDNSDTENSRV
jgi:hypothetical protein